MTRAPETTTPDGLTTDARTYLTAQDGLITRAQALSSGVTKETIRWRAGRHWRVVLPRTYLVGRESPSERQRLVAALLWAGPRAYLTGDAAARLHGMGLPAPPVLEMLTPWPGKSRHNGFASVRRTLLDDVAICTRGPIRYASPARSAVDAALRRRSSRERTAVLVEAVQRGLASVEELHEWTCRLRDRDGAQLVEALDHAATGAWSAPEAELVDLVLTSSVLPEPWTNPPLRDATGAALLTPDLWFDDVGMAVLVHSFQYHSQGEDWVTTVERDGDLTRLGVVVVGVTPTGLRRDGAGTLRRLEETYAVAARRPRPDLRATRRPTR